jgi:cytidylate kinase
MSIITISRGTYSKGKEIAEKLADRLGYRCISREVLLEASHEFNIAEVKLVRALHDAPSVLNRFTSGKEKYVAFIRKALLESVLDGNVIYHGLAGHFLLREIPHVFKVRIVANLEDRVKEETKRKNISEKEARHILKKDDEERRKWSLSLYGIDTADASLYDMVIHVDKLTVDDAVDILSVVAGRPCFQPSAESRRILDDLALAARAESVLVDKMPTVKVASKDGCLSIIVTAPVSRESRVIKETNELLKNIDGVKKTKITVVPMVTEG